MLNETRSVGTDIATWFLFNPHDLDHRRLDPAGWCFYEFAVGKEFAAGNLIAITTGANLGFSIRFTDQELTEDEQQYALASVTFRLRVRHNWLLLTGGNSLPSADMLDDDPDASWVKIPNGSYQVIVHTFDWEASKGKDLPSYTIQFQPVENLNAIDYPPAIPQLDYLDGFIRYNDTDEDRWRASDSIALQSEYPLLEWVDMVFPSSETTLILSQAQYQTLELIYQQPGFRDGLCELIVGQALASGAIGSVVGAGGYGYQSIRGLESFLESVKRNDWLASRSLIPRPIPTKFGYEYQQYQLFGGCKQLVRLVRVFKRDNLQWAEVEAYEPPNIPADAASIEHLKRLFAWYAISDECAGFVAHRQFYAEQIASLSVAREVCWAIAPTIDLTPQIQRDLLISSDRDFVQELIRILEQKLQPYDESEMEEDESEIED